MLWLSACLTSSFCFINCEWSRNVVVIWVANRTINLLIEESPLWSVPQQLAYLSQSRYVVRVYLMHLSYTRSLTIIDVRYNNRRPLTRRKNAVWNTVIVSRHRLCFSQICRWSYRIAVNIFSFGQKDNRSRHFDDPRDLSNDWDNARSVGDRKWNVEKYVNDKTIQRTHYLAGFKLGWFISRDATVRKSKPDLHFLKIIISFYVLRSIQFTKLKICI